MDTAGQRLETPPFPLSLFPVPSRRILAAVPDVARRACGLWLGQHAFDRLARRTAAANGTTLSAHALTSCSTELVPLSSGHGPESLGISVVGSMERAWLLHLRSLAADGSRHTQP